MEETELWRNHSSYIKHKTRNLFPLHLIFLKLYQQSCKNLSMFFASWATNSAQCYSTLQPPVDTSEGRWIPPDGDEEVGARRPVPGQMGQEATEGCTWGQGGQARHTCCQPHQDLVAALVDVTVSGPAVSPLPEQQIAPQHVDSSALELPRKDIRCRPTYPAHATMASKQPPPHPSPARP